MERLVLYPARVVDGVVEINQAGEFKKADDVIIQGAGIGDSNGYCIIGQALALYFVNTQPNLQSVIDQVVSAIDETINIANQMVVKVPTSPAVPLDTAAAAALEIIKTDLESIELS